MFQLRQNATDHICFIKGPRTCLTSPSKRPKTKGVQASRVFDHSRIELGKWASPKPRYSVKSTNARVYNFIVCATRKPSKKNLRKHDLDNQPLGRLHLNTTNTRDAEFHCASLWAQGLASVCRTVLIPASKVIESVEIYAYDFF